MTIKEMYEKALELNVENYEFLAYNEYNKKIYAFNRR